jgi:L-fuculose-phosphate aldolase
MAETSASAASSLAASALAGLGRRVVAAGLVVASGGNLSARVAGADPPGIVVTPRGWPLDELDPATLPIVGLEDGSDLTATASPPTTELAVHLAAYRARPDVSVVVHLHPPMATLLHALGRPIRRITTDHAYYVRRMAEVPFLHPGSDELADAVAAALGEADVVLLRHHGCVVVADTFDLALSRAANLEAAAVATYRSGRMGDGTTECPPEHLARVEVQEAAGFVYGRGEGAAADSADS